MASRGITAGAFAAIAGGTVIYILEGVPRVQNDIFKKLPLIGGYWTGREKPASDNVCLLLLPVHELLCGLRRLVNYGPDCAVLYRRFNGRILFVR